MMSKTLRFCLWYLILINTLFYSEKSYNFPLAYGLIKILGILSRCLTVMSTLHLLHTTRFVCFYSYIGNNKKVKQIGQGNNKNMIKYTNWSNKG